MYIYFSVLSELPKQTANKEVCIYIVKSAQHVYTVLYVRSPFI